MIGSKADALISIHLIRNMKLRLSQRLPILYIACMLTIPASAGFEPLFALTVEEMARARARRIETDEYLQELLAEFTGEDTARRVAEACLDESEEIAEDSARRTSEDVANSCLSNLN
jgi:hypothetical protein